MKPDAQHPQYAAFASVWRTCRDAATGQRSIHAGGELYLPKLSEQTDDQYKAYKARALYFNATGRTVEGMVGLIFRKSPVVEVPKAMESWLEDINHAGKSLYGFVEETLDEIIKVGRGGILIDFPPRPATEAGKAITIDQAQKLSLRPYMAWYCAEDILNWKTGRVGNLTKLVQVFLSEAYDNEGKADIQIRELTILTGSYAQNVWRKRKTAAGQDEWYLHETVIPVKSGKPLTEIPFFFLAPREPDADVQAPPIEDLAYINISHYQNSADLENGAHVSGLPTPVFTGVTQGEDDPKIHLGTGTSILLPDPNSKAEFLHVGSEGFASLEKLMDRKEQQMAAIGARIIAPEKKGIEAAETAQIRRGGESSVLAAIAGSISMVITKALLYMAEWGGITGEPRFELNKDYLPAAMDAAMLRELVAAWQSGAISEETFFETLQAGEMVPESLTFEDEKERKADSPPPLGALTDPDDGE